MLKEYLKKIKAISDGVRIRILILLDANSLCVCEIEKALDMSQSRISQHLLKLKNAGMIDDEQDGKWKYYRITTGGRDFLNRPLINIMNSVKKDPLIKDDLRRLKKCRSFRKCK